MPHPELPSAAGPALQYRAHGKLLLTGEYAVLDGALALALPSRRGQQLRVEWGPSPGRLDWESLDTAGARWFHGSFSFPDLMVRTSSSPEVADRLLQILEAAGARSWDPALALKATTRLEFPRHWGLGSSSTLLALLGAWTGADPFHLARASFGGSGYDLACAQSPGPILYQLRAGRPHYVGIPYAPPFTDDLYFVALGDKQDTRAGIARYRERARAWPDLAEQVSRLTWQLAGATELARFEAVVREHEALIASALDLPRVQEERFPDYWGSVKSLGAWGGDFVLATSRRPRTETLAYFQNKGYHTVLPYAQLVLGPPSEKDRAPGT